MLAVGGRAAVRLAVVGVLPGDLMWGKWEGREGALGSAVEGAAVHCAPGCAGTQA